MPRVAFYRSMGTGALFFLGQKWHRKPGCQPVGCVTEVMIVFSVISFLQHIPDELDGIRIVFAFFQKALLTWALL